MKFRRFLSGLLFGLGCALCFIGLLAIVLPAIDNPQLQLVLGSFEMSSDRAAVQAINRLMSFALAHSWQVLYLGLLILAMGTGLVLHFTPKFQKPQKPSAPPPPPELNEAEKPNPFANAVYGNIIPKYNPDSPADFMLHAQPILERNQVEETEPVFAPEEEPLYFSPRFTAESHAIDAEIGAESQSGSRILIRSMYGPASEPLLHSEEAAPAELFSTAAPSAPTASPPPTASSPRIRSTMGRHTIGIHNLPSRQP